MHCDRNKLQALTGFCRTDHQREALLTVHFDGENAVACNGEIAGFASFSQSDDLSIASPVETSDKPFNVASETHHQSNQESVEEKVRFTTSSRSVLLAPNTAASFSDTVNCAKYKDMSDQSYPDVKSVMPKNSSDDTVVSISKKNLGILFNAMGVMWS